MKMILKGSICIAVLLSIGCAATLNKAAIISHRKCVYKNETENITKKFDQSVTFYTNSMENDAKYLSPIYDKTLSEKLEICSKSNWKYQDLSKSKLKLNDEGIIDPSVFDSIDTQLFFYNRTSKHIPKKIITSQMIPTANGSFIHTTTTTYTNGYNSTLQIYNCETRKLISEYHLETMTNNNSSKFSYDDSLYINQATINLLKEFYFMPKFFYLAKVQNVEIDKDDEKIINFLLEEILFEKLTERLIEMVFLDDSCGIVLSDSRNDKRIQKFIDLGVIESFELIPAYREQSKVKLKLVSDYFYSN